MEILEELNKAVDILNEIEREYNNAPNLQSEIDSKLSDLYHYIENNKLNASQGCRAVSLLHDLRQERRKILNSYELLKEFKLHENKLVNNDNRKLMIVEIRKRERTLNCKYKNRIYTEEELESLIGK